MSTKLYQLELDQSIVNCGMSYVFRLESGNFFIIDGGYFTLGEEDRLFSFLSEKAIGTPVIKGWLFTHAHQDHIGCFMRFIEKYHNDVTIEKLYFNFQPTRHRFAPGSWEKKCNDLATIRRFYKIIKKYSSYFEIHRLCTDETIKIDELTLEVLYTADNLYPKKASFNDYSAVFAVNVCGQRIMFLGDVQKEGSAYLLENKHERLKADICQLAHHGFNGATKELYKAISPKTILYPAPDFEFEKNKESDVNRYVLQSIGVEKVIVSGYGDCEITLPYNAGEEKISKKRYR